MKLALLLATMTLPVVVLSQVKYEVGSIIKNDGAKIECLILNRDWKDNPSSIRYKLKPEEDFINASISDIREFSVSHHHYVRVKVKMDKTSQDLKKVNDSRAPDWEDREVFLKVIVDGRADLFYHSDPDRRLFFFRVNDAPIEQLIFKYYITQASKSLKSGPYSANDLLTANSNLTYMNQLNTQVKCIGMPDATPKNMKYERHALGNYFSAYNKCSSQPFVNYDDLARSDIHITIRPGINFTALKTYFDPVNESPAWEAGPRIGLEFEIRLAVNKRKWGVLLEPTYQSYEKKHGSTTRTYKSLELPLALRHYFFLTEKSQVFVNAGVEADLPINCSITGPNGWYVDSKISRSLVHGMAGLGFANRRISLEARYHTYRNYDIFEAVKASVIIGYRLR